MKTALAAALPPTEPSVKLTRYLCSAEYGTRTVGRRIAATDAFAAEPTVARLETLYDTRIWLRRRADEIGGAS